ncbi:MAG: hypothetical protein R3E39_10065 [Anaerolineae bacterium]
MLPSPRLLVRVGGGYRFIHDLLHDHIAEMTDPMAETSQSAQ